MKTYQQFSEQIQRLHKINAAYFLGEESRNRYTINNRRISKLDGAYCVIFSKLQEKIKPWHVINYPNDSLNSYLSPDSTFEDLLNCIINKENHYNVIFEKGYFDSLIRERCFHHLAILINKDDIYIDELWTGRKQTYINKEPIILRPYAVDNVSFLLTDKRNGKEIKTFGPLCFDNEGNLFNYMGGFLTAYSDKRKNIKLHAIKDGDIIKVMEI